MGMEEKARQLLARLSATPDSAVPDLPFLYRALLLPLLSSASTVLRLPLLLSSSPLCPRRRLPVPVVSVGNLTWGGNGKTPMVEFLARRFHSMGISPLLLTRGYAGGDESKMLQRRLSDTSAKIGVGANRAAVATSMLEKYGYIDRCDTFRREKLSSTCNLASTKSAKIGVAILDDGMQHRSLLRDLEIVMVNGLTPWGNTHLIPRGSMREPLSSLNRADIVVIHHADIASEVQLETIESTVHDNSPTCPVFFSKLAPSHIFEANQPLRRLPLHVLDGMIMLCVSAIGCPDAFIHTVRELWFSVLTSAVIVGRYWFNEKIVHRRKLHGFLYWNFVSNILIFSLRISYFSKRGEILWTHIGGDVILEDGAKRGCR